MAYYWKRRRTWWQVFVTMEYIFDYKKNEEEESKAVVIQHVFQEKHERKNY